MSKFIAEIDMDELAVRIVGAFIARQAPLELSAKQALDYLEPDDRAAAIRAADAAIKYVRECFDIASLLS